MITHRRLLLSIPGLLAFAILSFGGCISQVQSPENISSITGIDIGINNLGTELIEDASVTFGDYHFSAGPISPGHKKVHVCSGKDTPDVATIAFELQNGEIIKKQVSVKQHVPSQASGALVLHFNIDDKQNIQVEFLHFIMEDGRSKLVSYDPKNRSQ